MKHKDRRSSNASRFEAAVQEMSPRASTEGMAGLVRLFC